MRLILFYLLTRIVGLLCKNKKGLLHMKCEDWSSNIRHHTLPYLKCVSYSQYVTWQKKKFNGSELTVQNNFTHDQDQLKHVKSCPHEHNSVARDNTLLYAAVGIRTPKPYLFTSKVNFQPLNYLTRKKKHVKSLHQLMLYVLI